MQLNKFVKLSSFTNKGDVSVEKKYLFIFHTHYT